MTLLSASQLTSIQQLGLKGMTADVVIYSSATDLGLDLTDDPYGSKLTVAATGVTVKGWLVGRWSIERGRDAGDVDTSTSYRLRLPVGTSIEPGWEVDIGGNRYNVIDAGTDQTWPEWLSCTLRRSK
jgi:hypothetical protein